MTARFVGDGGSIAESEGALMNDDMRLRSAINLDELERQLREAAGNRGASSRAVPPVDDPLAELARLVGHTEPVREPAPSYPGFGSAPIPPRRSGPEPAPAPYAAPESYAYPQDPPPPASPSVVRPREDENVYAATDPYFESEGTLDPTYLEPEPQPKPKRTGMYILAAMAVVAAGGVGVAAWMKRDAPKAASGTAPVIAADTTPAKVAPPNPGGVEVPNQNTQIYNRSAPDDMKTAKVVPSEEQPVDVAAAQRLAGNPPPATGATPGTNRPAAALGMGEPKKVRSVTVRPDGTVVEEGTPMRLPSAADPTRPQLPPPVATAPNSRPAPATPAAAPSTPTVAAPATPSSAPARPLPPTRPETTESARPAPAAPTTVAAAPAAAVAVPAPAPAAPSPAAPLPTAAAGSGDYAVQLAAPGSESEARDAVTKLQQRYASALGGNPLSVRQADVNGKTLYRVRVTGLSREDANATCERVKSAGGQCFVARN